MSKQVVVAIEDFAAGMTSDIREETKGKVKLVKHFDILTRPNTLTPYHSQITGDALASTDQISDFLYSVSQGTMFGVGVDSTGTPKTRVYSNSGFTSSTWSNISNGVSSSNDLVAGTFVEYHGFAYGLRGAGLVWKADLSGSTAWNDDAATGALSGSALGVQGLVHSKDDVLYMAAGHTVASNNNGSWNKSALVLPSQYSIVALAEYGNYLAVGCNTTIAGKSVVYLWDRNSSLNTITEVIDWGTGVLRALQQVESELVGVSIRNDVNTNLGSRLDFRRYSGAVAELFFWLLASTSTGLMVLKGGQKQNERLYFGAGITIDGVLHNGIWALGKDEQGHWMVWFDRLPNNDTAIAASSLVGFFVIGDFMYVSYNDSGYHMTMTDSSATGYTGSSLIETVMNPEMPIQDRKSNKQLLVIQLSYDPLPTLGQVILKYKVDGGAWTTILTTLGSTAATNELMACERTIDASGTEFTSGREYQFRVESTGGALITGLKYKYEVLTTNL